MHLLYDVMIPYKFIERTVEKLLGVQEEDDEFEVEAGEPIVPQIETFARERSIELENGWKVILAKAFKKSLLATGKRKREIPESHLKMWVDLFKKLCEK